MTVYPHTIRKIADAIVTKISLGYGLTKLQDKRTVNMTPKMGWFERTFTKNLEEELVGQM